MPLSHKSASTCAALWIHFWKGTGKPPHLSPGIVLYKDFSKVSPQLTLIYRWLTNCQDLLQVCHWLVQPLPPQAEAHPPSYDPAHTARGTQVATIITSSQVLSLWNVSPL